MGLCQDRRGVFVTMEPIEHRQQIVYDLPLAEIVLDFYDQLKTRTRGYASLDYELIGYRESPLVKLDILLAGEPVDALSSSSTATSAYSARPGTGGAAAEDDPAPALRGARSRRRSAAKIIARETVKAQRKDVLAKCYGGDISRKRKLLERQKEGKKRMKQVGRVEVPQEAFLAVLQIGDSGDGGQAVSAGVRHLYLHLPFCASRCGYCAFVVEAGRLGPPRRLPRGAPGRARPGGGRIGAWTPSTWVVAPRPSCARGAWPRSWIASVPAWLRGRRSRSRPTPRP